MRPLIFSVMFLVSISSLWPQAHLSACTAFFLENDAGGGILGKNLKYIDITINDLAEGLKKANTPEPAIKTILSIAEAMSAGELDIVDDSLEKLLQRKPMGMEEFLRKTLVNDKKS